MNASKRSTLRYLWLFMRMNKKFWLLPLLLVLIGFGALVVFAESSAFAPLIYTIF